MTPPLVSCIVPVFNGERFLAEGIRSVLGQTHSPLEVVVVDDGSTDGTADIARSFGDPVVYVRQDNAGPAAARNRGLEIARGDFISFLDADDLWLETKLERQLARFEARPELGYSVTLVQNFWEEEVAEERDRMADHMRARPIPGYVTLTLLTTREWMDRTGGFDATLAHGDAADWFRRADAQGAVGELLDEVLARRRLHGENRSRTKAADSRTEFLTMLKKKLDKERRARQADSSPSESSSAPPPIPLNFAHSAVPGRVSCIVPVFDGEAFVAEAVESILAQTHPTVEVIVVDDGSKDGTAEVLAGFGDRIRVLHQPNQGPAAARNRGLAESRGEYIAFLDADDVWVEDKLAAQLEFLTERPDVELCSGHLKSFWIPELDDERRRLEDHPYHQERPMLSPCTMLTTRAVFERVGGFDPSLRHGEDTDWFIRASRAEVGIGTLPRLLVHRRQHRHNLTRAVRPSPETLMEQIRRSFDLDEGP